MRLLHLEWRPILLVAGVVGVLSAAGWLLRFRFAVEVQFYSQGIAGDLHPAVWHMRRKLGPEAVSRLQDILASDSNPRRRDLAAHKLGLEEDPRSTEVLTKALWDNDRKVRASAYYALSIDRSRRPFGEWMQTLSDQRLVEVVRGAQGESYPWSLFFDVVKHRRSSMVVVGEALLESSSGPANLDLVMTLLVVETVKGPTPEERALIVRLARLGTESTDARIRHCCRSKAAQLGAASLTEDELVEWTRDLASAEYILDCAPFVELLTELEKRNASRFDGLVGELLAQSSRSALPWTLLKLVDGVTDEERREAILRAGLASPDDDLRDSIEYALERLERERGRRDAVPQGGGR